MKNGMELNIKVPQFIDEAVYGLCELNRDKVKKPDWWRIRDVILHVLLYPSIRWRRLV